MTCRFPDRQATKSIRLCLPTTYSYLEKLVFLFFTFPRVHYTVVCSWAWSMCKNNVSRETLARVLVFVHNCCCRYNPGLHKGANGTCLGAVLMVEEVAIRFVESVSRSHSITVEGSSVSPRHLVQAWPDPISIKYARMNELHFLLHFFTAFIRDIKKLVLLSDFFL